MKKFALLVILFTSITVSCSKKQSGHTRDTYEYFKTHLTADMNYAG